MFKPFLNIQFVKYVTVGLFITGLDFLFLYTLVEFFHLFYLLSALLSMTVILWISFTLNKYWTFKNFEKKYFRQFGQYCVSHLIALGIGLSVMVILVQGFHFWYIWAKAFATFFAAVTNFFLVKKFIFFQKSETID